MRLLALSAFWSYSALAAQTPLTQSTSLDRDAIERDASFIFNSVHNLLRGWGNTISPNGFSFTRGSIPPHTNLYHARGNTDTPASPEWLAFDPEMSYSICYRVCHVYMQTYRTTRALAVLYLDGNSASLGNTGTLDASDVLTLGYVKPRKNLYIFDDVERAIRLCKWATPLGYDGIVRQNAGFELIKCDFMNGLRLVKSVEATQHEAASQGNRTGRSCMPHGPGQNRSHTVGDPLAPALSPSETLLRSLSLVRLDNDSHPSFDSQSSYPTPYYRHPFHQLAFWDYFTMWQWLRSASWVLDSQGENRVSIDWKSCPFPFVTAYGREGLPLQPSLQQTHLHRLTNLSAEAATDIQEEVNDLSNGPDTQIVSGIDWRGLTDQMVWRYGTRLGELESHLQNGTDAGLRHAMAVISMLLNQHFDFDVEPQSHDKLGMDDEDRNLESCVYAFLPSLSEAQVWSSSEQKVYYAIAFVQRDICRTLLFVYRSLLNSVPPSPLSTPTPNPILHLSKDYVACNHSSSSFSLDRSAVQRLAQNITSLSLRLDWSPSHPSSASECSPPCDPTLGEVCMLRMWPLNIFDLGEKRQTPVCLSEKNWWKKAWLPKRNENERSG